MFSYRSLLLCAIAGGAIQSASAVSISSQCQSELLTITASPDASCINPSGLAGIMLQSSSSSIINPVDTWLHGLCALPACSNASLTAIVTNITTGCSTDLSSALGGLSTAQIASFAQSAYPTLRKIACLENTANSNKLCVTETLTNVQTTVGTLTLTEFLNVLTTVIGGGALGLPSSTVCTNCTKAAYSIAATDYTALIGSQNATIQQTCGASFTDGTIPSIVIQTAGNSTANKSTTSGASSLLGVSSILSSLVGLVMLLPFVL